MDGSSPLLCAAVLWVGRAKLKASVGLLDAGSAVAVELPEPLVSPPFDPWAEPLVAPFVDPFVDPVGLLAPCEVLSSIVRS
jgi:hypothetical protein